MHAEQKAIDARNASAVDDAVKRHGSAFVQDARLSGGIGLEKVPT